METQKPAVDDRQLLENKADGDEIASDRESSVESFHTNKSELSIPTESELIDVDDIELSDEESWLYKSPKKQVATKDKELSTYNWLHKDVEYMDDLELLVAKKALVSKLDEIKMFNPDLDTSLRKVQAKETKPVSVKLNCDNIQRPVIPIKEPQQLTVQALSPVCSSYGSSISSETVDEKSTDTKVVESIMDIHEMARLQEESLRQSTSKFFNESESRSPQVGCFSPVENIQGLKLKKPVSVEALYMYSGKQSPSSILNTLSPSIVRKSSFSSSLSINQDPVSYRGSLPNINNGYYSLRHKKSKHPSEQKLQCPLPIYPSKPKIMAHEMSSEALNNGSKTKLTSIPHDNRESRTLPSSYRMNSRSKSASRRESNAVLSSPRRESTPFLSSQKNNSFTVDSYRRDSAPCNGRKFVSPIGSPTQFQRNGLLAPVLLSPNRAMSVSNLDHQRTAHSPTRRLPLSTVLNQSPRCGRRSASPFNGEMRGLKMPPKIPSPASRSGIPVPSTQYISRPNADDDSWSQEFF